MRRPCERRRPERRDVGRLTRGFQPSRVLEGTGDALDMLSEVAELVQLVTAPIRLLAKVLDGWG